MCANICGEKFGDTVPLSNMCETTCNAGPAVEGSVRVDTDRVLDTAAIVVLALVDVVASPVVGGEHETVTKQRSINVSFP